MKVAFRRLISELDRLAVMGKLLSFEECKFCFSDRINYTHCRHSRKIVVCPEWVINLMGGRI